MGNIFISYAKDDEDTALSIYHLLKDKGFSPWIDIVDLLPGQIWEKEIEEAIRNSSIFIACISTKSILKRGYVQTELNYALKILDTIPEGNVFIIPVRIEKCEVPKKLLHLQYVDFFFEEGREKLIKAISKYLPQKSESTRRFRSNIDDLRAIRELLKAIFKDDRGFSSFCHKYFHFDFTPETPLSTKIELFVHYCRENEEFGKLINDLGDVYEEQYGALISAIGEKSEQSILEPRRKLFDIWLLFKKIFKHEKKLFNDTKQIRVPVEIKIDHSQVTPEELSALIGAIAGILSISREKIRILDIYKGSLILRLEIPSDALDKLIALYEAKDPVLSELGISYISEIVIEEYKLTNIRKLIIELFSLSELKSFCLENFKDFGEQLPSSLDKITIVDRLIEYASQDAKIPTLLESAYKQNPKVYSKFRPYYNVPRRPFAKDAKLKPIPSGLKQWQFLVAAAMGLTVATVSSMVMFFLSLVPFIGGLLASLVFVPMGQVVGEVISKGANYKQGKGLAILSVICYVIGYRLGFIIGSYIYQFQITGEIHIDPVFVLVFIFVSIFYELANPFNIFSSIGLFAGGYLAYRRAR